MSWFSVFRASFDGALHPRQRRTGRIAAYMATSVTVLTLFCGFLAVLHLNANQLTDLANASSAMRASRVVDVQTISNKACDEQKWPFIEGTCLIQSNPVRKDKRVLPAKGLASHEFALASRKKKSRRKTLVASAPRVRMVTIGKAGAAGDASPDDETQIPLPMSRPQALAALTPAVTTPARPAATPPAVAAASTPRSQKPETVATSRRPREQTHREAQRRERLTREQREARAERQMRYNDEQSARRWNQYGYPSQAYGYAPQHGDWQRARTAQRGLFDGGGFFPTIR